MESIPDAAPAEMQSDQPMIGDLFHISTNQKAEKIVGTNQKTICLKEVACAASGLLGSQLVSACVQVVLSLHQAVDRLFPTEGDH